jgi:poly(3-hydroxybutyrate) depolymerase
VPVLARAQVVPAVALPPGALARGEAGAPGTELAVGARDKWGGLKNPPRKSSGCGKPAGITNGMKTIMSAGKSRDYSIDVPADYDQTVPHRVVFIYHWSGGSAASMKNNRYYNIQPLATAAKIPTVFIAPTHGASEADHTVFLDLLAYVETNLCVDSTRIFATGYSLGGMMTYSLTTKHQDKLRAGVGIAAANFNVWLPNPKIKEPIAYMGITGMQDDLCVWDGGTGRGAKYIALEKAADNGCSIPAGNNIPTWTSGNHVSYEFQGCKDGYPVIASTFNGPHGGAEVAKDPGASSSWVPKEIWEFFMRF